MWLTAGPSQEASLGMGIIWEWAWAAQLGLTQGVALPCQRTTQRQGYRAAWEDRWAA